MSKLVRATERGYYGDQIREEGDEFQIGDDEPVGGWMKVLDEDTPEAGKKGGKKSKADLQAECDEAGIEYDSHTTKAELESLLADAGDGESEDEGDLL